MKVKHHQSSTAETESFDSFRRWYAMHIGMYVKIIIIIMHSDGCTHSILALFFLTNFLLFFSSQTYLTKCI